jgi:enoyl-[acyl-carrier protein] reductase II
MATEEAESHTRVKKAVIGCQGVCTVSVPKEYMLARDLVNQFTKTYLDMKQSGASRRELANYLAGHSQYHSQFLGQADDAEICCGQVAGLIRQVKPAREVVAEIVRDMQMKYTALKENLQVLYGQ